MLANFHENVFAEIFKFLTNADLLALSGTSIRLRRLTHAERDRRAGPLAEESFINVCKTADRFLFLAYVNFKPKNAQPALITAIKTQTALIAAIDGGDHLIIEHTVNMCLALNVAFSHAVEKNNLFAVKLIHAKNAKLKLNGVFRIACRDGFLNIVKYLVAAGTPNLGEGLSMATTHGRLEVVKYIASQDPERSLRWKSYINDAQRYGRDDIVAFINELTGV